MSEPIANIIGVGNILMRDDGAGPTAAGMIEAAAPAGVRVWDAGLAVSDVIGMLNPDVPLIVVDAVRRGGEPGSVYRIDLEDGAIFEESSGPMLSLHEISVLPALRMEALSGRRFCQVTVFGVEPELVEWGEGLTGPVAAALPRIVDAVLEHLKAPGPPAPVAGNTGERNS